MPTNSAIITRVRQATKDTNTDRPRRSNATLALILTESQDFINTELELLRQEFTLTPVADTRFYDVNAAFQGFPSERIAEGHGLVYWTSDPSGDLKATTVEKLDAERKGWRAADSGTPREVALQSISVSGTAKYQLVLDPAPDDDFVSDHPSLTYYGIYRPTDIGDNASEPFDGNVQLRRLHRLLILHTLWTIDVEDGNMSKLGERWARFLDEIDVARTWVPKLLRPSRGLRFDKGWRNS